MKQEWAGWEREKPAWFNDCWKAKVPPDWVPEEGRWEWEKAKTRNSVRARLIMLRGSAQVYKTEDDFNC